MNIHLFVLFFIIILSLFSTTALSLPSPLNQFKQGKHPDEIQCNSGLKYIIKAETGLPACVKPTSVGKLFISGWASKYSLPLNIICDEECAIHLENMYYQCNQYENNKFTCHLRNSQNLTTITISSSPLQNRFMNTTVALGINSTVTWVNTDNASKIILGDNLFNSGQIQPDGNWTYAFNALGAYHYHDQNDNLKGQVNVIPLNFTISNIVKEKLINITNNMPEIKTLLAKYPDASARVYYHSAGKHYHPTLAIVEYDVEKISKNEGETRSLTYSIAFDYGDHLIYTAFTCGGLISDSVFNPNSDYLLGSMKNCLEP